MSRIVLKSDTIAFLIFASFCFFEIVAAFSEELRHLKYSIPLLSVAFFLLYFAHIKIIKFNIITSKYFKRHFLLYSFLLVLSFIVAIAKGTLSLRMFHESFFVIAPLLSVAIIALLSDKVIKSAPDILLFTYIIVFFISEYHGIAESLAKGWGGLNVFVNSTVSTESTFCFSFGTITLYFLLTKRRLKTIIALLFTILSFKRIVLLAIFLLFIMLFFSKKISIQKNKGLLISLILCGNFATCYLFLVLSSGYFDNLIYDLFGISAEAFTMGRKVIFADLIGLLGNPDFLGIGIGNAYSIFALHSNLGEMNIHSDLLKGMYEFGYIGFIIWIFCLYKFNLLNKKTLFLTLYLNILFATDNVFIYFHTMFPFYLLQANLLLGDDIKNNALNLKETNIDVPV